MMSSSGSDQIRPSSAPGSTTKMLEGPSTAIVPSMEKPSAGHGLPGRQSTTGKEEQFSMPSQDPYSLRDSKLGSAELAEAVGKLSSSRKQTKVKKYYNRQNALIDAYLASSDEEALEIEDHLKNGGKVKFAVNASFVCNFCLFVIQLYAAVSTGSPSLFATAADAFVGRLGPEGTCLSLTIGADGPCQLCGHADHLPNGGQAQNHQVSRRP
jgi:hypothetical protein